MQVNLWESKTRLWSSHEQVWLPVAGQTSLWKLPCAGGWTDLCGTERLLCSHCAPHYSCTRDPGSPYGANSREAFPVPPCAPGAPISELQVLGGERLCSALWAFKEWWEHVFQRERNSFLPLMDSGLVCALLCFHFIHCNHLFSRHAALQVPRAADNLPVWLLHYGFHRLHCWILPGR